MRCDRSPRRCRRVVGIINASPSRFSSRISVRQLHIDQRVIAVDTREWLRRRVSGRDTSRVTVKVLFATAVLAGREGDPTQQHKVIATSEKCARECLSPHVALTMHFAGPGFL